MASITKLPSGRWRALIRKKGSPALSETFNKEADARKWANSKEQHLDSVRATGKASVRKEHLFSDFVDAFIAWRDDIKPISRSARASLIASRASLGKVPMGKFSEQVLTDFAMGRLRGGAKGPTIAVDLSAISAVLKWASQIKHYDIDAKMTYNVRRTVHTLSNINSDERDRMATKAELSDIYAAYAKQTHGFIPMPDLIKFALATSMRQGEICNLMIEDVDSEQKTIVIRERKNPTDKARNDQTVPLFPDAWDLMVKHAGDKKRGLLFPFNEKSVSASFTRIVEKCGIKDLHFHDLRHTAITEFFNLGLRIEQVAVLSGHKDWKMLKRYTHINAGDVQRTFQKLQEARELELQARLRPSVV